MNLKKPFIVAFLVMIMAVSIVTACSKGYQARKKAGDFQITIKANRYPLAKGPNTLFINVMDSARKPVTDAAIQVRYYKPRMTGTRSMVFNTTVAPKGEGYSFVADIPVEGVWKIDVMLLQPDKPVLTATFNVKAR